MTLVCCQKGELRVQHIGDPDYPLSARFGNLQGTVKLRVEVDPDGRVIYAKGSGAPDVLVKAAEDSVRTWIFGPFPRIAEFPISHSIQYVYILVGDPKTVAYPPAIKTYLPDRIEIRAVPLVSDYPPLDKYKPAAKTR